MGQATLFGPLDYSLRIWLDPDRLTELNLTPNDIIAAVQSQNIQAALGRWARRRSRSEQQVQITIKTKGRLTRPEEFEAIVLRANPDGSVVRIKDVARVKWAQIAGPLQPLQWRAGGGDRHLPDPGLQRGRSGAQGARDHEHAGEALPRTISAMRCSSTPRCSSPRPSRRSFCTLAVAIVLVALVVFLFLGRWRTTLIPLLAVPVSIIGTFAVMLLIGYSANTVSLLGARARDRHRGR